MAMATNKFDVILAIVLIVLGILVLVGELSIPLLPTIIGILLIVVGVLMLLKKQNAILSVVLIVLGILTLTINQFAEAVSTASNVVIGVVLLALGILKLMNKW